MYYSLELLMTFFLKIFLKLMKLTNFQVSAFYHSLGCCSPNDMTHLHERLNSKRVYWLACLALLCTGICHA